MIRPKKRSPLDLLISSSSESSAALMDAEARKIVYEAFVNTENLLRTHRDSLEKLAAKLLEQEVLTSSDVESIIGPSPFKNKKKVAMMSGWKRDYCGS